MTEHLSAIILAAGFSGRMGRFKPLLPLGPTTIVERVVMLYRSAGIEDICVVTGHKAEALDTVLQSLGVRCIVNPAYAKGMFSSLRTGLSALPNDCRGFFVHPVDIAFVRRSTIIALMTSFHDHGQSVIHPAFDGLRGHPPLVPAALAPAIFQWPGPDGLRGFWAGHKVSSIEILVADQSILVDLDTEEEYQKTVSNLAQKDLPSPEECRALMTQVVGVPEPVWFHCQATANVADALAAAVNKAGGSLELNLIRCAALVHDIGKMEKHHAQAGANLLEQLDYPRIAAVVRVHMDIETTPEAPLDEAQIVYLADKLLEGSHPAGLDERLARKLAKYGTDEAARQAIQRRFQMARWIYEKVERMTGRKVQTILS
ncbi:MAG: NTP transferase domain-containing protein [Desulfobacteraceae bacterium]|nr:NTP transferase domain-containing protein [Desulfobacteraceae bacterium]